jgi:RNA polymerase sigma factor (sigma-70 family)
MGHNGFQDATHGVFQTTHWSVILTAGPNNSQAASAAWEELAKVYWYPVYAHVRRRVSCPEQAKDFVQEFFASLIHRESLARVAPEKGRFRTFLLNALKYFLADQHDRNSAAKRGGGQTVVSFDAMEAEERHRLEPLAEDSPDKQFDRRWAAALIEHALARLEREQREAGRTEHFQLVREFLAREVEPGEYDPIAAKLGQTTNAIASSVRRLRLRLHEIALEEAMKTTLNAGEGADELRALFT